MRIGLHRTLVLAVLAAFSAAPLFAATVNDFEGGGTPVSLEIFSGTTTPGATIEPTGGNPGGFLQLTDAVNDQHTWATFDNTDAGTFPLSQFNFDFLIDPTATGPSADGFSFSYADTATFGTTGGIGAAPFTAEDPAASGILGFGFDTWSNEGTWDTPGIGTGSDYQEISVFWDGMLIERIDDTRLLGTPLVLDDATWHEVSGVVNFAAATVSLSVDGQAIFSGLSLPGLVPFESRIMFAARTGGENELVAIDNLLVDYLGSVVPGDANGDGVADFLDFEIIRDNLFTGRTLMEGDVDFDGDVDLGDFAFWKSVRSDAPAAIPEPAASLLLLTGLAMLLFSRRGLK